MSNQIRIIEESSSQEVEFLRKKVKELELQVIEKNQEIIKLKFQLQNDLDRDE
tara:strand:+ start:2844 stop:3002 length:159 start_codon:yes stop_codon:yes gene_type:complete